MYPFLNDVLRQLDIALLIGQIDFNTIVNDYATERNDV